MQSLSQFIQEQIALYNKHNILTKTASVIDNRNNNSDMDIDNDPASKVNISLKVRNNKNNIKHPSHILDLAQCLCVSLKNDMYKHADALVGVTSKQYKTAIYTLDLTPFQ